MARPTKEAARARDTVAGMDDLEDWVTKYAPDARNALIGILLDPDATITNRKGVAETILQLQKEFFRKRKSSTTVTVDDADSDSLKEQAEENGGFPVLKTAFNG